MYSFPNFEPVHSSMSGSNCCLLTRIWVSQESGKVVWYSHLLNNFSKFIVIHTVKDSIIGKKEEIEDFLELCCFSMMYSAYKLNKQMTICSLDMLLSQFGTSLSFHVQF